MLSLDIPAPVCLFAMQFSHDFYTPVCNRSTPGPDRARKHIHIQPWPRDNNQGVPRDLCNMLTLLQKLFLRNQDHKHLFNSEKYHLRAVRCGAIKKDHFNHGLCLNMDY